MSQSLMGRIESTTMMGKILRVRRPVRVVIIDGYNSVGSTTRSNIARAQKWVGHYWGAAARGQRGHGGDVVSTEVETPLPKDFSGRLSLKKT